MWPLWEDAVLSTIAKPLDAAAALTTRRGAPATLSTSVRRRLRRRERSIEERQIQCARDEGGGAGGAGGAGGSGVAAVSVVSVVSARGVGAGGRMAAATQRSSSGRGWAPLGMAALGVAPAYRGHSHRPDEQVRSFVRSFGHPHD